jgi:hypothetical protein
VFGDSLMDKMSLAAMGCAALYAALMILYVRFVP